MLLDGTGAPAFEGAVLVKDGCIASVYCGYPPVSALPSNYETISLPGTTLMPGLIDVHAHLCLPADGTIPPPTLGEAEAVIHVLRNANVALRAGITTLRDCGGLQNVLSSAK